MRALHTHLIEAIPIDAFEARAWARTQTSSLIWILSIQ